MEVVPENSTHLWFDTALVEGEWRDDVRLSISGGQIAAIERNQSPQPGDERCSIGLPGLPNLHSHGFQRGMAGLAETRGLAADSFWTWRETMYHFLDRLMPEDLEAITAQAYVEMLESGFTRVGEFHYLHHDCDGVPYANPAELAERIRSAAEHTGINLTLLPSFYAHANFGGLEPTGGQRRFVTSVDRFARIFESARDRVAKLPGAKIGVAPHSLRAVTPEELQQIIALCPGGPVHIHAAEQAKEVADCLAMTGKRPVQWLLENFPVDQSWCLIHATHLTRDELSALAQSGATVGLCPITEANLGDGIFPALSFVEEGGIFGIGTDSNVNITAAGELCALEYAQRLASQNRNVLASKAGGSSGRALFTRALAGGNRALQSGPGSLAPGTSADIISLTSGDDSRTAREGGDTIFDQLIFSGRSGPAIDRVWVRGQCVVMGGRHVQREEIRHRFRTVLRRIL